MISTRYVVCTADRLRYLTKDGEETFDIFEAKTFPWRQSAWDFAVAYGNVYRPLSVNITI